MQEDAVKTLITGGTGFVGLNVAEELLRSGDSVIALGDRAMPDFAEKTLMGAGGKLTQIICDVSDGNAVREVFERFRPGRVIHAAVITAGEEREFREFERVIDVNIQGTTNVLQSALNMGADKVIYV